MPDGVAPVQPDLVVHVLLQFCIVSPGTSNGNIVLLNILNTLEQRLAFSHPWPPDPCHTPMVPSHLPSPQCRGGSLPGPPLWPI